MSVLVTGGAGYIGSHCVAALCALGEEVVVADNLSTGHRAAVPPRVRLYEGSICDAHFLEHLFASESIDTVVHFAAFSLVGESVQHPNKYFLNNLGGSAALLDAMARAQVKNLVFSSTAAAYGEPASTPIVEDMPARPINPYGLSKLMMENIIEWNARAYGLRYAILRYFNVAGAAADATIGEDHRPETHLIPIVLGALLGQRDSIRVFGEDYDTPDGTCVRDYIHVADLIDAHLLAVNHLRAGGKSGLFNLGTHRGFSVREIIEAAFEVTGRQVRIEPAPRRAGDPAILVASSHRAAEVLGWTPRHRDPRTVIESAWRWHLSHPNGYE